MARILITGSADGLGRAAAESLIEKGHEVIVHARSAARLATLDDLMASGATGVVGDLAVLDDVRALAMQVNGVGRIDAVIHNAGVLEGPSILPVNVVAPYVLTALIEGPARVVYLSSSMHRGGSASIDSADWGGSRKTLSYSDSKLLVTVLMAAGARRRPATISHAVDPGWVPTKMGGRSATDDLALGHVTQVWLVTTDAPEVLVSGRYWHHQRAQAPHPAVHDERVQEELLAALAAHTGITLAAS